MSYVRTFWKDRVVERPRTFTQVTNADGSITQTNAPGQVIEPGTPLNATNFNNLEEGLVHYAAAFELLYTTTQAQIRDLEARLALAEAKLKTIA